MTKVVNLYAGPGAGKSTTAAKIFGILKDRKVSTELVQEYVKQWAWEKRKPVDFDQFYFFGKQARRESSLLGNVDVIVTDAPVLLTSYYAQVYGTPAQACVFRQMYLTYSDMCHKSGHQFFNFWLSRTKAYDPRGRFQDEAGAKQIDEDLRRYMKELGVPTCELVADETVAERIVNLVS